MQKVVLALPKPTMLYGFQFSKVTSKKEWINQTMITLAYPSYGYSAINSETCNIHYTANHFWEQQDPTTLLLDIVKKLSVNKAGYDRIHINTDSRALNASQQRCCPSLKTELFQWTFTICRKDFDPIGINTTKRKILRPSMTSEGN